MAPSSSISDFQHLIQSSNRILALCGTGLSASCGPSAFRSAAGLWRNHEAKVLATADAFRREPGLVWLFFSWRRHVCLKAKPNHGHYCLARLAREKKGFMCLTQSIDGLFTRAGHPSDQLLWLRGSLLDLKCSSRQCTYVERDNLAKSLRPSLAIAGTATWSDLLEAGVPQREGLPQCPRCADGSLLRPGVTWLGDPPDSAVHAAAAAWLAGPGPVDLVLVVGAPITAPYLCAARAARARVAVIDPDPRNAAIGLGPADFFFPGNPDDVLPVLCADPVARRP